MKVVIPLIPGTNNNIELRYTLRSLQAYYGKFQLLLIGHKPDWVRGATHIECGDMSGSKAKEMNIALKLYEASRMLYECFLYSSDDNYILPSYHDIARHKGFISGTCAETKSGSYRKSCENTIGELGFDALDYDLHCPAWIDPVKFAEVYTSHSFNQDFGLLVKSTYFNGTASILSADIKIHHPLRNLDHLKNVEFFSTFDGAVNKHMIDMLESLFPVKSRFE